MSNLTQVSSAALAPRIDSLSLRRSEVKLAAGDAAAPRGSDTVELSDEARRIGASSSRIESLKAEIASGSYDLTPEKLDKVVDGLLRDLEVFEVEALDQF